MHHMKQRKSLANTIDNRRKRHNGDVIHWKKSVHSRVGYGRSSEDECHSPDTRKRIFWVQIVLLEVFEHPFAALFVEAAVRFVSREFVRANEFADLVFGEHFVRAVAERMVRDESVGAFASSMKMNEFASAWMLIRPFCKRNTPNISAHIGDEQKWQ